MDTDTRTRALTGEKRTSGPSATLARLVLLALAALVPLLIAKHGSDYKMFSAIPLALMAACLTMAHTHPRHLRSMRLTALALPLLLWIVALGMGTTYSPVSSVDECSRLALYALAALGVAVAFTRADSRRFAFLWVLTFIPVGGYALAQHFGLDPVEEFRRFHSADRVFSTFGNPDFLGAHVAFLLPLTSALALSTAAGAPRIALAIVIGIMSVVLLWTGSRGAWLGATAGMAAFALLVPPNHNVRRIARRVTLICVAAVIVLSLAGHFPYQNVFRATQRPSLWKGGLLMLREKPLAGWGLGSFVVEYAPFAPDSFADRMAQDNTFAEHSHCEYLNVAVELGVPSLGIFLWLLTTLFRRGILLAGKGDSMSAGTTGALAAIALHIAVDRNFRLASTAVPFWIAAGTLFAHGTSCRIAASRFSRWHPLLPALCVIALILGALSLRPLQTFYRVAGEEDFLKQADAIPSHELESRREANQGNPEYFMSLGNSYAKEGVFGKAIAAYGEAVRISPDWTAAINNMGNCYFMQSRFADAARSYNRVLAQNPSNENARFNLAYAYYHQRRIKEALRECELLLKQNPHNPKARQLKEQITP